MRIANARNVAIDSNTFTNFRPAYELGDHPDMIQVWNSGRNGDMSGITITNNTLSKGDGEDVQAIFIQGALPDTQGNLPAMAHDIVVSGNTVETGVLQGIWLQDVAGAIIADNLVTQSAGGVQAPTIRMDGTVDSTVIGNIAPVIQDFGSTNLIVGENTLTALTHVTGTAGADTLEGTSGADSIVGALGSDVAYGHDGNDTLLGGDGNDTLDGGTGNDLLNGGAGKDELHGRDGADAIYGGGGDDRILGEYGDDKLFGDGGRDMLNGGAGNDTIHGGNDADGIYGGGGNDLIFGDSGNDTIRGDGGMDTISGGTGDDIIYGGAQADTFVFTLGGGNDTVMDFTDGIDWLDLSALTIAFEDLTLFEISETEWLVAYLDGGTQVTHKIQSSSAFSLDVGDFIL